MENKLNKKLVDFKEQFYTDIKKFCEITEDDSDNKQQQLCDYLDNYPWLEFNKTDFYKKSRSKNTVSTEDRCLAIRANSTQCTRRKKSGSCFCGTHVKGTPYGTIPEKSVGSEQKQEKQLHIFSEEISGINYYLDDFGNIYKTEDVLNQTSSPKIIGKYTTKLIDDKTHYYRID